jgi:hypothetical protein
MKISQHDACIAFKLHNFVQLTFYHQCEELCNIDMPPNSSRNPKVGPRVKIVEKENNWDTFLNS